jgi:hypothetical protein
MGCTPVTDRRADRAGRIRPAVVVRYQPDPRNARPLREIDAGLEEEGVPFRAEEAADGSAAALAYAAAQASPLGVGVGVCAAGNICVHHAKLPPDAPVLAGPPRAARTMGHNAARLVTGIPFKSASSVKEETP